MADEFRLFYHATVGQFKWFVGLLNLTSCCFSLLQKDSSHLYFKFTFVLFAHDLGTIIGPGKAIKAANNHTALIIDLSLPR